MEWNGYAQIGYKLQKAFKETEFSDVTRCDFVLEILDRLHLKEEGYCIVAIGGEGWFGGCYRLYAIPCELMKKDPAEILHSHSGICDLSSFVSVEQSAMGIWQACLLRNVKAMMPLFWHDLYHENICIFNTDTLLSLEQRDRVHFICKEFIDDPRLQPTIKLENGTYYIKYCYWNDWQGLVQWTDFAHFDDSGRVVFEERDDYYEDSEKWENDDYDPDKAFDEKHMNVLFEYWCKWVL